MKGVNSGQTRPRSRTKPVADVDDYGAADKDNSTIQKDNGGEPADSEPLPYPTREEKIAIIAYYKAERRGFATSGELDDWLEAEREVDRIKKEEAGEAADNNESGSR